MESFKTTAESYAKREAVAGAQQKRALAVLSEGRLRRDGGPPQYLRRPLQSFPNRSQNRTFNPK